jgi:hypothetical protein
MWPALPTSDYYGGSPRPRPDPIGRRWTQPQHPPWPGAARTGRVPVFTADSLDGGGARLCPSGIATATPQHFTVASRATS